MHYYNNPSSVRVDFFKPSGKWYTTEAINWDRYNSKNDNGDLELIHETFARCLKEQLNGRYSGMIAVCLDPYHEHSHPLMLKNW